MDTVNVRRASARDPSWMREAEVVAASVPKSELDVLKEILWLHFLSEEFIGDCNQLPVARKCHLTHEN